DRLEKEAARPILRKHGAHDRRGDDALIALIFALERSLDGSALELPLRRLLVLGLAAVAPADTSRSIEPALGIEGVVEGGHGGALHSCAGAHAGIRRRISNGRANPWVLRRIRCRPAASCPPFSRRCPGARTSLRSLRKLDCAPGRRRT